MNSVVLSVVICTYNRANKLTRSLESLARSTHNSEQFEIIVVNNNCTDNTSEVISDFQQQYEDLQVLEVLQPKQGLNPARNKGIEVAQGDYLAFIDDDVLVEPQWVSRVIKRFNDCPDSVKGIGGDVLAKGYDSNLPTEIQEKHSIQHYEQTQFIENNYLVGGNMIYRAEIFEIIGPFREDLGHRKNIKSVGGETEFQKRIEEYYGSESLLYDPDLKIRQLIDKDQLQTKYRLQKSFSRGRYHLRNEDFTIGVREFIDEIVSLGRLIKLNLITLFSNEEDMRKMAFQFGLTYQFSMHFCKEVISCRRSQQ